MTKNLMDLWLIMGKNLSNLLILKSIAFFGADIGITKYFLIVVLMRRQVLFYSPLRDLYIPLLYFLCLQVLIPIVGIERVHVLEFPWNDACVAEHDLMDARVLVGLAQSIYYSSMRRRM